MIFILKLYNNPIMLMLKIRVQYANSQKIPLMSPFSESYQRLYSTKWGSKPRKRKTQYKSQETKNPIPDNKGKSQENCHVPGHEITGLICSRRTETYERAIFRGNMEPADFRWVGVFGKIIDRYFTEHLYKNSITKREISKKEILMQLTSEKNHKTNDNMLRLSKRC